MTHCTECGTKLEDKFLEHEGMIPYCPSCEEYRFPFFNTAVSMITIDPKTKKILLVQQYGRKNWILVAGYITKGETAEAAVHRELGEEVSLKAAKLRFNKSQYFAKSNSLLLNFAVILEPDQTPTPNWEVDSWQWFTPDEARAAVKPGSLAEEFLLHFLKENPDL